MFFDLPREWSRALDLYCERDSAAFWGEPVNALSNVAFLIAAALIARSLRGQRGLRLEAWPIWLLVAFCAAIGLGSFLFHTIAQVWAAWADIIPIQLFILWYVACFLRFTIGMRWPGAMLGPPGFLAMAWLTTPLFRQVLPAGSAAYLPAQVGLVVFAAWALVRGDHTWRRFAAAAIVFAGSIALRTMDEAWCAYWPLGTHFLWHVLNALTLWMVMRSVVRPSERV